MKDRLPVARLIHEALRRTGYDALLLAEFLGERKLANLHKLDRAGAEFRPGRHLRAFRFHRAAVGVRRPAARRAAGRHPSGIGRRGAS